jgi:hypothetical protein
MVMRSSPALPDLAANARLWWLRAEPKYLAIHQ